MEVVMHEASTISVDPNGESVTNKASAEKPVVTLLQDDASNTSSFKSLPPQQSIELQFENIVYTASLGFRKGKKEILHDVSGRLPPAQLIAIIGPSGAGKTTLLDILSGYRIRGVKGIVYANGVPRNLKSFRKTSCYIQQDNRLQPLLTTSENMQIAADLKLRVETSRKQKKKITDEILKMLGIYETKNTVTSRLSGGQRKRLSIALELINNPTTMFLDEPTTGLDSSSCSACIRLLKNLARQGRTIVCTIHQPSASLFQIFDQVYVLGAGRCLYQGSTENLVPFLSDVKYECPKYHNPADFAIELACEEYGIDIVNKMVEATENGRSLAYFSEAVQQTLNNPIVENIEDNENNSDDETGLHETSPLNQLKVLLRRGYIKSKRDLTLTYLRFLVNVFTAIMLGTLYWQAGSDGSKILHVYNLLFAVVIHHLMATMMLTILTFPSELSTLIKEHFNRWYSLKMYYISVTIGDIPVSIACCVVFSLIVYSMTGQPWEAERITMFTLISMLVVFIAQSFGLMVGAIFNLINGTFMGPALSLPLMLLSGFRLTLKDLPRFLYYGSYGSYVRYGFAGVVGALYGLDRPKIWCPDDAYCHYKYPKKFLEDFAIKGDDLSSDVIGMVIILFIVKILAYVFLRHKLMAIR